MEILVALHNIMRWVVVLLAVFTLVRSYRGWFLNLPYSDSDRKAGLYFGISMDIQLLLGLILWIFGNWGLKAFGMASNLEGASRMAALFFTLEHPISMLIAVVLVHIGSITAKRVENSRAKFQRTALFYSLAVIFVLIAIPWMQRPLFPGL